MIVSKGKNEADRIAKEVHIIVDAGEQKEQARILKIIEGMEKGTDYFVIDPSQPVTTENMDIFSTVRVDQFIKEIKK